MSIPKIFQGSAERPNPTCSVCGAKLMERVEADFAPEPLGHKYQLVEIYCQDRCPNISILVSRKVR